MPDIKHVVYLLSNEQRTKILVFLMDNRLHTVNEITKKTSLKANTVSFHLKKLHDYDWLLYEKRGKFHYYRLKSPQVAMLIEQLLVIAPRKELASFSQNKTYLALKKARICYDHLAGSLGVEIFELLIKKQWIINDNSGIFLTEVGVNLLRKNFCIDLSTSEVSANNNFILTCYDWSEKKNHLGGTLGKKLAISMLNNDWIYFNNHESRAISLTDDGIDSLNKIFTTNEFDTI